MKFYIFVLAAAVPFLTHCGKKKVASSEPAPVVRTVIDENYDYLQGGWQQMLSWKYPEFIFRGRSFRFVTQQRFDLTTKVIEAVVHEGDFSITGNEITFDIKRSSCPDDSRQTASITYEIDQGESKSGLILRNGDVYFRMAEPDLRATGMELRTGCRNTVGAFTPSPVKEVSEPAN